MVMIQEQFKCVGIELKIEVAEDAKFHDYNRKNLQPHMALVGGVELPHAQPACQIELSGGGGAQLVLRLDCGHGHPGVEEWKGFQHGQR